MSLLSVDEAKARILKGVKPAAAETVDIEDALGMFQGNIFQNAPTFPFAQRKEQVGTWGVETDYENVFFCGSSACRGGAVSGIPGHNAAMKILKK